MPRTAMLDAPVVLHHIMIRGIERRKIFMDDNEAYRSLPLCEDLFAVGRVHLNLTNKLI
jgi:hypothetical protein